MSLLHTLTRGNPDHRRRSSGRYAPEAVAEQRRAAAGAWRLGAAGVRAGVPPLVFSHPPLTPTPAGDGQRARAPAPAGPAESGTLDRKLRWSRSFGPFEGFVKVYSGCETTPSSSVWYLIIDDDAVS